MKRWNTCCETELATQARVQASDETLQEFAAALEQLAHRASVGLQVTFIQTEVANFFIDGIRDSEVKQSLLLGGDCHLNDALDQALNLEAAKATAEPQVRLETDRSACLGESVT